MKKSKWTIIGYKEGEKHNTRLGYIIETPPVIKAEATKIAQRVFKRYIVTDVR